MPRFTDNAVVLRSIEWSESSQIVVLLTEAHGKVRGLAKGAKRMSPSSVQRFSGGIELLTIGEVIARTRPTTELAVVTEWDLRDDLFALRRDLRALELAAYAASLCDAVLAPEDPHPWTYHAIRGFLDAVKAHVAAGRTGGHDASLLAFQWAVLTDNGYMPELHADVHSGEAIGERASLRFDPRAGGLTRDAAPHNWGVRGETVALLRTVADAYQAARDAGDPTTTLPLPDAPPDAPPDAIDRANRLLCSYARALLDTELPAMRAVLGQ